MTQSRKRRLRRWTDHAAYLLIGVVIAMGVQLAQGRVAPAVIGWLVGLVMAAAGLWACLKGPRVDEVALAGVKFAWLWGGFAGLALGFGLFQWAVLAGSGIGWPASPAELRAFAAGIIIVIGVQLLAYLAILAGWWWRKGGL
ncbi:hypothetical protein [Sandarakinorhabdus oryzae]|uniref:hypothetical protein n=1 Tax=Sandarakinorhabdus oryzae TaxID=2675220 RepID=UPI0012E2104A|nr:hypothetical protein [Sandarakinorhabdus oryzae]